MRPFDLHARDFYDEIIDSDFSNSILQLPNEKTFPVEFGMVGAGILMKRRLHEILVQIMEHYDATIDGFQGLIFIGPPGSGKVCTVDSISYVY